MTVVSIDEYIFIMWVRSLTDFEKALLYELVVNRNTSLFPLCISFLQNYPHSLLDIAITISSQ